MQTTPLWNNEETKEAWTVKEGKSAIQEKSADTGEPAKPDAHQKKH